MASYREYLLGCIYLFQFSARCGLVRLMEFLKIVAQNSCAKGVVDTPEDECSSDNLLNKDFLSHP